MTSASDVFQSTGGIIALVLIAVIPWCVAVYNLFLLFRQWRQNRKDGKGVKSKKKSKKQKITNLFARRRSSHQDQFSIVSIGKIESKDHLRLAMDESNLRDSFASMRSLERISSPQHSPLSVAPIVARSKLRGAELPHNTASPSLSLLTNVSRSPSPDLIGSPLTEVFARSGLDLADLSPRAAVPRPLPVKATPSPDPDGSAVASVFAKSGLNLAEWSSAHVSASPVSLVANDSTRLISTPSRHNEFDQAVVPESMDDTDDMGIAIDDDLNDSASVTSMSSEVVMTPEPPKHDVFIFGSALGQKRKR